MLGPQLKNFSIDDNITWSYKSYTIIQNIIATIPSCRKSYLPEKYNEALLRKRDFTKFITYQKTKHGLKQIVFVLHYY